MAIVTKNTETLITEAISIPSALLLLLLPTTTDTFPLAAARCMTPSIESTSLTFYTPLHTQEAATHQIISIEYKKNRRGKGLKPATFPFNSSWLPVDKAIRSFLFLEARRSITSVWCRHEMKSSAFSIPSIPNIIPWQQFQSEGRKKKRRKAWTAKMTSRLASIFGTTVALRSLGGGPDLIWHHTQRSERLREGRKKKPKSQQGSRGILVQFLIPGRRMAGGGRRWKLSFNG